MKNLKHILQSNYFLFSILIITIIITAIRINIKPKITYDLNTNKVTGILLRSKINENKLTLTIKGKDKIQGTYYFKTTEEKKNYKKEISIGNKLTITGKMNFPKTPTTNNLFNYKEYLKKEKIYFVMQIETIKKEKQKISFFYKIKNKIKKRATNPYIKSFLLGDQSEIKEKAQESFQKNGISHLFAIGGIQFILIKEFLLKILKKTKLKEKTIYKIILICLLFYLSILNVTASVIRAILFFILFSLNKYWALKLKNTKLIIIAIILTLLINPYYIKEAGFWYSYIISIGLICFMKEKNNYLKALIKSSSLAFLLSIPISLYYFYEINLMSIIYNLFYIPLINIIIFPASILTFLFPIIEPIYNILIKFLESSSIYLNNITFGKLIFAKIPVFFYILELIFIVQFLKTKKKIIGIVIIIGIGIHYLVPNIFQDDFVKIIDVGQGDSILIYSKGKSALIDTGGKLNYNQKNSSSITKYITIPLLKSLGIKKLDYIFLTHGDYDHMGEAINLVENFKVEKVIFNCGDFNELEKYLIKVLAKKKIKYYSCIKELNIDNNKLYFLNSKDYGNENDNSSVIYTELNKYKFLFMGDASVEVEKDLIEKYNLQNVDVLKVGHHGSKTSSSEPFIDEINPKYSIISVGKNNRYGHPNDSVLDNLENSKIYRTDEDGSIMFKIKNNKLKIETCTP